MIIRPLIAEDKNQWLELWHGYLDFYGASLSSEQTTLTFARLIDVTEPLRAFITTDPAGTMQGFAHVLQHRSSFAPIGYLYLEDLFVSPTARGQGMATALIQHCAQYAAEQGLSRLHWETQSDNPARTLYDRLATCVDFVQYRMLPKG